MSLPLHCYYNLQASIFMMKEALSYVLRSFQFLNSSQTVKLKSWKTRRESPSSCRGHFHELCRQFSLMEIKAATKNFHKDLKIGDGGFGDVYEGVIDNGSVAVAVKRLSKSSIQGIDEFQTEVLFLCQLCHQNLVSLIGFCNEGTEMILVYEYMCNLSLDVHLFTPLEGGRDPLSWEKRLKICIAVARALHYLHTGVKYAVIHGDVKSSNVLLDENWIAKISDFGLSKMGPLSMSKSLIKVDTLVKGTYGYADPGFTSTGELTEKSDVYSFGVLLLEVLCARRVFDRDKEEDQVHLTEYACKCIESGSAYDLVDPYLEGKIAPESFSKFVKIAFDCLHEEGRERPSMGEVEVTLELALELQEQA